MYMAMLILPTLIAAARRPPSLRDVPSRGTGDDGRTAMIVVWVNLTLTLSVGEGVGMLTLTLTLTPQPRLFQVRILH